MKNTTLLFGSVVVLPKKKKGKRYEKAMEESTVHGDGAYDDDVFLHDGGGGISCR